MNNYFDANLKSIVRANPYLGTKLFAMKGVEEFDVYVDEKDMANINIIDKRDFTPIYQAKPIDETIELVKEFEKYSRYPYLYFYGIGNGIFFKLLLGNEQHKRIIIIEPEIEVLYIALHFNDYVKDIQSGRLVLLCSEQVGFSTMQNYFQHEEKIYLKSYHLDMVSGFYERDRYHDDMIRVNKNIISAINHCVKGLGNDSTDALLGIEQHITNVEKMIKTPTTVELVQNAKNTDLAIIVSTGPSLYKQLPLLKEIKDYVTIISVDASLPILEKHDIKPDIVTSIERIPNTAKFFQSTSKEFQDDIIFALTSIQDKAVFESIKGGTQQISMRPFGYTRYFGFDNWGYIGIGMSAANIAFEIAYQSKFKRVVLIGQDLAYGDDGASHAKGHTFGENEKDFRYDDKMVTAWGGEKEIRTSVIWDLFRNFFEIDISNSKLDMETINATEGGARIEGAIEMSFADVVEKYVDSTKKKSIIKLAPQSEEEIKTNTQIARDKITSMLEFATKVKNEVSELFEKITKELEKFDEIEARKYLEKVDYDEVFALITELDHVKEYFNQLEFALVFADATQAFIFHQEVDLAIIQIRESNTDKEKKLKMLDWLYAHQYWLFSLAGSMKATIDIIIFGIDENASEEFLKTILDKYSDYESYSDYQLSKQRFMLKKIFWPYPDYFIERVSEVIKLLTNTQSSKELFIQRVKEYFKAENNFINITTYRDIVDSREGLLEVFGKLTSEKIASEVDPSKKTLMIVIKSIMKDDEMNFWLVKAIDNIMKIINESEIEDRYNVVIGSDKIRYMVEHIYSDEYKYHTYVVGMDMTPCIQSVDCFVTARGISNGPVSWKKGYTPENGKNMMEEEKYPEGKDVYYITEDNYENDLVQILNKLS
jgi:hypothetical protein